MMYSTWPLSGDQLSKRVGDHGWVLVERFHWKETDTKQTSVVSSGHLITNAAKTIFKAARPLVRQCQMGGFLK